MLKGQTQGAVNLPATALESVPTLIFCLAEGLVVLDYPSDVVAEVRGSIGCGLASRRSFRQVERQRGLDRGVVFLLGYLAVFKHARQNVVAAVLVVFLVFFDIGPIRARVVDDRDERCRLGQRDILG